MARPQSPTLITLGRLIRTYRKAAGMIQKELANKLGYTNAWLSNVETGQLHLRPEQITAFEEALKIPKGILMVVHDQLDKESLRLVPPLGQRRAARGGPALLPARSWSRACSRPPPTRRSCSATRRPSRRG